MSILSQRQFHDEAAAFAYVEAALWPKGPICPHCGGFERISAIAPNPEKRVRIGLKFCGQCRKQFTVRMGTIFEESKLPMTKWLQAIFLMCSSKKGVSAHQLHRTLECTYKTAWFLAHRIREAMRTGEFWPFGQGGATVEVDETFLWTDPDADQSPRGYHRVSQMMKVVSLVERETGQARSFVVDRIDQASVLPVVEANLHKEAKVMTDQSNLYRTQLWRYASHETVNHSIHEYVNADDPRIHTNTIEGFFSIFKRGMRGVYQHCDKKHLHRYLAEFDFRYSYRTAVGVDDQTRAEIALGGFVGKRLTYRSANSRAQA